MAASQPRNFLPEDVLMAILCRLPVRLLVRYRCVCKAWCRIISSTSFITTHLAYQKTSSNKCMLYDAYTFCTFISDFDWIYNDNIPFFDTELHYPFELVKIYKGTKIYGIANGLLCLSRDHYVVCASIYLYNPSCRKTKKLPQLDISGKDGVGLTQNSSGLSFGYYDDDYKVIVIAPVGNKFIVYVYGLGNNSWKTIHTNVDAKSSDLNGQDAMSVFDSFPRMDTKFVLNTVYAMTPALVICFDLSDETIRLVSFPKELTSKVKIIEAYGETVAVFANDRYSYYNGQHHEPMYQSIWILRDKCTWDNKFTFNMQNSCNEAEDIGILDNGKYTARTCTDIEGLFMYFWCDLDYLKFTERSAYAALDHIYRNIHSNFVESLLLLNEVDPDPNTEEVKTNFSIFEDHEHVPNFSIFEKQEHESHFCVANGSTTTGVPNIAW